MFEEMLKKAISRGEKNTVEYLISLGADPNRRHKGEYPLEIAAKNSQKEIFDLLLKNNAYACCHRSPIDLWQQENSRLLQKI